MIGAVAVCVALAAVAFAAWFLCHEGHMEHEKTEAHLRSWSMQESRRTAAMIADSDAARAAREELIEEWGRM